MKTFIGGIGCFWDETKYDGIKGILSTECGYCGGDDPNVTYKAVCGGDTGHIEVVKVQYDENILSYEDMVRLFFKLHDSTQKNRQGTYVGIQYRSEIFYNNDNECLSEFIQRFLRMGLLFLGWKRYKWKKYWF